MVCHQALCVYKFVNRKTLSRIKSTFFGGRYYAHKNPYTLLNVLFNFASCTLHIQGDQKVSVHLMITIQKVTSNVQSVPRQFPDIY
jgi:hypothetical protein